MHIKKTVAIIIYTIICCSAHANQVTEQRLLTYLSCTLSTLKSAHKAWLTYNCLEYVADIMSDLTSTQYIEDAWRMIDDACLRQQVDFFCSCKRSFQSSQQECISLGCNCFVAIPLLKNHLRHASYPLDWVNSDDFEDVISLIKSGFTGYYDHEHLRVDAEATVPRILNLILVFLMNLRHTKSFMQTMKRFKTNMPVE